MARVTARAVGVLVLVLLAPLAGAQPVPDATSVVGPVLNDAYATAAERVHNETGVDLTREDVGLEVVLDFVNVELGFVGALFGSGKVQTDVDVTTNVTIRAVSVARLDAALRAASGDRNVSLNESFGVASDRMVLTASEIRAAGGGVVLQAFQAYQERATRAYVENTLPGLRVLSVDFTWANTVPDPRADDPEQLAGTEPPLILEARLRLQYLDRVSVLGLVPGLAGGEEDEADEADDPRKELKKRIQENASLPFADQNAFRLLSAGQLMHLDLPENWRLNLTLVLPAGFTVEGATHQFVVSDGRRAASFIVHGEQEIAEADAAGVVSVSNRFLVTSLLTGGVLAVGLVARALTEAVTWRARDRLLTRFGSGGARVTIAPRGDRAREARPVEPPRMR